MTSGFERRLRKLESQAPRRAIDRGEYGRSLHWLLTPCIAYYLGDSVPGDAPATAFAKALGYKNNFDLRNDMERGDADYAERYFAASQRLFAKFGTSLGDKPGALKAAFDRMEAGLSEPFRRLLPAAGLAAV